MSESIEPEKAEPETSPGSKNAGCGGCLLVSVFAIIMMIVIIKSISPTPPPPSETPPAANKWYQSGTLHKSTDEEWLNATPENRLATSSDFVAATKDRFQFKNMDELKLYSIQMDNCITKSATARANQKASDLALMCAILLTKK